MQPCDVVGVGNAIVDILVNTTDDFVADQGLQKGSMTLIDADRAAVLSTLVNQPDGPATGVVKASGGSAANTVAGVASFNGAASYIGKVGDDDLGRFFAEDMNALGVRFEQIPSSHGPATARCFVLVTPDAQRTMNTFLGTSALLEPADVRPATVEDASVLFCEGYLWDVDSAKQAIRKAMEVAKGAGTRVSLTLSDTFCIERHHQEFLELVEGPVDVLFANRAELTRLYECELDEAVERVAKAADLSFITLSEQGSLIVTGAENGGEVIEVPAETVADVVDTTGAGDQYAAGVLFGLARDLPLPEVGRLGSLAAAEVISHMGPRPIRPLVDFLD